MSAVPIPDPVIEDTWVRILLPGDLPSAANPPPGCRFHTRCPYRQPTRCDDERPALRELAPRPRRLPLGGGHRRRLDRSAAEAVVDAAVDEAPPATVPVPVNPNDYLGPAAEIDPPPSSYSVVIARSTSSFAARCAGHSAASTPTTPANRTKTTS